MATDAIIAGKNIDISLYPGTRYKKVYLPFFVDAGIIYKRLLNHRPVIQNEVHYFVKEFEVQSP